MRKYIREAYKNYVRCELLKTRAAKGISQERMAAILDMSGRAYTALESGKSCWSHITFALYLTRCCLDKDAFIAGLSDVLDKAEKEII